MDIATLIGLIAGVSLLGWAVVSGAGDKVMAFIDAPSMAIVIGGMLAATLISFPLKAVLSVIGVMKKAFLHKALSPQKLIEDLVSYAETARRDGILSLESVIKDVDDDFVVKGIQMAIDGTDPELIEQILNSELDSVAERHSCGKNILDTMGKYAPAFGMVGTLIGLVIMLQNMSDPSKIGPSMAIALLTTLYGAVTANLVCLPLAEKLEKRSSEELLLKEIVIRGVMSIQSGDNPRVVEQKLKTFLSPAMRAEMEPEDAAA
jgi:chemotaxis protein MotA